MVAGAPGAERWGAVPSVAVAPGAVDVPLVAQPAAMDLVEETQVWTAHRALCRARVRALPSGRADTVGFVHAEQVVQGRMVFSEGGRWLLVDLQTIVASAAGAAYVLAERADGEVIMAPVAEEREVALGKTPLDSLAGPILI